MKLSAICTRTVAAWMGLGLLAGAAQAETLSFATWQPEASQSLHTISLKWFADELEKRTDGEHSLRIHWGGTVAGIAEIGDAVETGVADMGDLVVPYHPDKLPLNNVISFFWPQPKSPLELGRLMQELHEEYPPFTEELARYNLDLIALRPLAPYGILCREPVRSLEEFAGKRIRSYGVALPAVIEALGAVPVSMSTVETYESLERGILDCTPIEPILGRSWNYDQVATNFIDVPMGASWGQFIVINQDVQERLPEDLRMVLDELGDDYLEYFSEEQVRLTQEVREEWTARDDFEIIDIPDEEFLEAVLDDPRVKQVRQDWIALGNEAGVPAEDIAAQLSFEMP